jgi:osmoprotectant transport system permease protein
VSSFGYFFIDGLQREFPTEIYVGLALTLLLALVCDLILVATRRLLTPWARGRRILPSPRTPLAPVGGAVR